MKSKERIKVNEKHLEVLSRLYHANRPVVYTKFLPDLNSLLDLSELRLVSKNDRINQDFPEGEKEGWYYLTPLGKKFYEGILHSASRRLNNLLGSHESEQ